MANRAIQAKILKLKKQKRKLPKNYQHVFFTEGTHKDPRDGPRDDDTKDYKDSVRYRARAKTIAAPEAPTVYRGVPPGRKQAIEMMRRIVETGCGLYFTVISNCHQECRVFYKVDKTAYVLVHVDYKSRLLRRSIEYSNKERVAAKWETGKIVWIETRPLARVS